MDIHLDMETQDPDDVFALCLLATHPKSNLKGVTLFPGGRDQVGVIKHVLRLLGRDDIPVGAADLNDEKSRVSGFHYKWLGKIALQDPDCSAVDLLMANSGATTLVTGAPLRNVGQALAEWKQRSPRAVDEPFYRSWTCQGGFAGDDVVPPEHRLEKFRGKVTCPTFNLNGDPKAATTLLTSPHMPAVSMVSKNVCHGVIFGKLSASRFPSHAHKGLTLLLKGMAFYFENTNPTGKALHDAIAVGLTFNPGSAEWARGMPYRKNGEWGFERLQEPLLDRRITVSLDRDRLYESWIS